MPIGCGKRGVYALNAGDALDMTLQPPDLTPRNQIPHNSKPVLPASRNIFSRLVKSCNGCQRVQGRLYGGRVRRREEI